MKTQKKLSQILLLTTAASILLTLSILITFTITNQVNTKTQLKAECPNNMTITGTTYQKNLEGNTTIYNPEITGKQISLDKATIGKKCNKTILQR